MTKNLFKENVLNIINYGQIENYYEIKNEDILKSIIHNDDLLDKLYDKFMKNYPIEYDEDDFYIKCQDFVCNLNMLVNDCLIHYYKIYDKEYIISIIEYQVDNDIDLYSAVSYDNSDFEILKNFIEYTGGINHEI